VVVGIEPQLGQAPAGGRRIALPDFEINDVGLRAWQRLTLPDSQSSRIAVALEGSLEIWFPDNRHFSQPVCSVLILPAGSAACVIAGEGGARLIVIQFDPAAWEESRLRSCAHLVRKVRHFRDRRAAALGWSMVRELAAPDEVSPLLLEGLAREMLAEMGRVTAEPPALCRRQWLERSLKLINSRYSEPLGLKEVARQAGVDPSYFSRVFRAETGCSVGAYVRALRVDRAAEMLATSERPIAEVALEAGFADQSHLSHLFRELQGMTPSRYRELSRRR